FLNITLYWLYLVWYDVHYDRRVLPPQGYEWLPNLARDGRLRLTTAAQSASSCPIFVVTGYSASP
ncbi:MAG: hypothetical protein LC121_23145, partial [Anaerolineae bacterium]|nr:hypothetical protein [Anaerolineae bacterium]